MTRRRRRLLDADGAPRAPSPVFAGDPPHHQLGAGLLDDDGPAPDSVLNMGESELAAPHVAVSAVHSRRAGTSGRHSDFPPAFDGTADEAGRPPTRQSRSGATGPTWDSHGHAERRRQQVPFSTSRRLRFPASVAAVSAVSADGLGTHATALSSVLSIAKAPTLDAVDRASIVNFLDEWAVYVAKTAGTNVGCVSLRQAITPKFLRAWCSYNPRLMPYDPATVPDDVLWDFLHETVFEDAHRLSDIGIDDMEAHLRSRVRFDVAIEDHDMRVDDFLGSFDEEVRLKGWQATFGAARAKETVRLLTTMLHPAPFKDIVKSESERRKTRTLSDFRCLVIDCSPMLDGLRLATRPQADSRGQEPPIEDGGRLPCVRRPVRDAEGGRSSPTPDPLRFGGESSATRFATRRTPPTSDFGRDGAVSLVPPPSAPVPRSASPGGLQGLKCFKCGGPHFAARCPSTAGVSAGSGVVRRFHRDDWGAGSAHGFRHAVAVPYDDGHSSDFDEDGLETPLCGRADVPDEESTRDDVVRRAFDVSGNVGLEFARFDRPVFAEELADQQELPHDLDCGRPVLAISEDAVLQRPCEREGRGRLSGPPCRPAGISDSVFRRFPEPTDSTHRNAPLSPAVAQNADPDHLAPLASPSEEVRALFDPGGPLSSHAPACLPPPTLIC